MIVTLLPGAQIPADLKQYIRRRVGKLDIINGEVLELPNYVIQKLESRPEIFRVHHDRPIELLNYRTSVTVGAQSARQSLGYKGRGVGVAVIDSGISAWHDDLTKGDVNTSYPYGNQRVAKFVDFVNGASQPYDDNGHGTHVSGIIAGNGYDSNGEKAGIAPEASLVSLKVLDGNGLGTISNIIAALNWVAVNHQTYNIKVVNLSVGARIRESVLDRPADARDQGARRSRHRRRRRLRQLRQERAGPGAVRRHHRAVQRAVGAHGRRQQHAGHDDPQRRRDGRATARTARPTSTSRPSRTSWRRARARCRWPRRAASST